MPSVDDLGRAETALPVGPSLSRLPVTAGQHQTSGSCDRRACCGVFPGHSAAADGVREAYPACLARQTTNDLSVVWADVAHVSAGWWSPRSLRGFADVAGVSSDHIHHLCRARSLAGAVGSLVDLYGAAVWGFGHDAAAPGHLFVLGQDRGGRLA